MEAVSDALPMNDEGRRAKGEWKMTGEQGAGEKAVGEFTILAGARRRKQGGWV